MVLVRLKVEQSDLVVVVTVSIAGAGGCCMEVVGTRDQKHRCQLPCRWWEDPKRWREECKSVECWSCWTNRLKVVKLVLEPSAVEIARMRQDLECDQKVWCHQKTAVLSLSVA